MRVELQWDAARALALLRNGQKRIRYAVVNALNTTAKQVQQAERQRVLSLFVVRKREFVLRQAAIIKFARVKIDRYEVSISVGRKPRFLLGEFEVGGTRRPFVGKKMAVPVIGGARPTLQQSVPESLFVKKLGLRRRGKSTTGQLRTYVVPRVGIFQSVPGRLPRRGADGRMKRAPGRILYAFKPSARIPASLHYIATGRAIAQLVFGRELTREVTAAFRYQMGLR